MSVFVYTFFRVYDTEVCKQQGIVSYSDTLLQSKKNINIEDTNRTVKPSSVRRRVSALHSRGFFWLNAGVRACLCERFLGVLVRFSLFFVCFEVSLCSFARMC